MEHYNQTIRNRLKGHIESYLDSGLTLYKSASRYADVLYAIEDCESLYLRIYRNALIDIMSLDAYKLYSYRQKECITDDEDFDFFNQLLDIIDEDDLLAEVSANPGFLSKLIMESYHFHSRNELGKINIVKSLSDSENEWLEENFPMHKQDLKMYDFPITVEYLIQNMKQQIIYQKNVAYIDSERTIMMAVAGFIRNLVKVNDQYAIPLLLELAATDYMCVKKLSEKIEDDSMLNNHIDFYENNSKNNILNELIENQNFLLNAVWTIADVYINGEYQGTKVNQTELDLDKQKALMKKMNLEYKE